MCTQLRRTQQRPFVLPGIALVSAEVVYAIHLGYFHNAARLQRI
jgi:hypothetical protein